MPAADCRTHEDVFGIRSFRSTITPPFHRKACELKLVSSIKPTISRRSLMVLQHGLMAIGKPAGGSSIRSVRDSGVHKNDRGVPSGVLEVPETSPRLLMAEAAEKGPPREPRSLGVPSRSQRTAWGEPT